MLDKAGREYWDALWTSRELPKAVDPRRGGVRNYLDRRFHELFRRAFAGMDTRGKRLLEIGCARSSWLPYFVKEFGFQGHGIDYSEVGCRQAEELLRSAGVEGEVVCADFFSPPVLMLEAFDAVVSFGVAEHFEDTAGCVAAFSRFLKPGGLAVTVVPNMGGLLGLIQKSVNRAVCDTHVRLDQGSVLRAHAALGFEVLECDYFLPVYFGVCDFGGRRNSAGRLVRHGCLAGLVRLSMAVWLLEEKMGVSIRPNRLTSPYITCIARKAVETGRTARAGARRDSVRAVG